MKLKILAFNMNLAKDPRLWHIFGSWVESFTLILISHKNHVNINCKDETWVLRLKIIWMRKRMSELPDFFINLFRQTHFWNHQPYKRLFEFRKLLQILKISIKTQKPSIYSPISVRIVPSPAIPMVFFKKIYYSTIML